MMSMSDEPLLTLGIRKKGATMSNLTCIETFHTRIDADMAKSYLEANGIKSEVLADDCGTLRPHMLVGASGARLMVREENAQKAEELLENPNGS